MTSAAEGTDPASSAPVRGGPQRIPTPPGGRAPGASAPWAELSPDARRPSLSDVRAALVAAGPAVPSPVESDGFAAASLPAEIRRMIRQNDVPARASAVLAPLYDRDGEAWVVLTRRAMAMRAHAGEVSFPGGRAEAGDVDLVHTALREAEEEIGLEPASVEIIGELDHLATVTSGSYIVPWVGALPTPPELRLCSAEVDLAIEVPLSELMAPGVFREEIWDFGPVTRPIVFFDLFGDTVWGATAAMLRQLLGFVTGTVARGELGHD
ncbi:CoA pyrophosphatase [Iamia sp.]|uniref:NUDIX hydrolase n=1 Tax=Iamia sp. TaxID=2722710 RepID=UPI002C80C90C|nr:CoA pyrophosphatase [Iamia sp.]HXH58872.1 CoA pyrophosphatase [Iamia sp.]